MSTKTTFKRVALVVVAALGFGVLTSVAPASAAPKTASSIVVGTVPTGRVGVTSYVPIKIYAGTLTAGETLNVSAEITSAPLSGGAANIASALGGSYIAAQGDDNNGDVAADGDAIGLFSFTNSSSSSKVFAAVDTLNGRVNTTHTSFTDSPAATAGADGAVASHVPAYVVTDVDAAAGYISMWLAIKPDVTGTYTGLISGLAFKKFMISTIGEF